MQAHCMGTLNKFGIHPSNAILAQVSFTVSEINFIRNQQCNQSQSSIPGYAKPNINLAKAKIQAIFERKYESPQKQYVNKLLTRKEAKCCTCSSTIAAGKLYVFINGFYILPDQRFAMEKKPYISNLRVPPVTIETRHSILTKMKGICYTLVACQLYPCLFCAQNCSIPCLSI